jgi:hypothetical protein
MGTLFSVEVIEVYFAGLCCKNSIQKHAREAVILLGILYDTECFFFTWDRPLQTKQYHKFLCSKDIYPVACCPLLKKHFIYCS